MCLYCFYNHDLCNSFSPFSDLLTRLRLWCDIFFIFYYCNLLDHIQFDAFCPRWLKEKKNLDIFVEPRVRIELLTESSFFNFIHTWKDGELPHSSTYENQSTSTTNIWFLIIFHFSFFSSNLF